jgi:hypothetical protein
VNIMSKEIYKELLYIQLVPTSAYMQLANQSTCYIEGVAIDLLVKIKNNYVPTLDMGNDKDTPLILVVLFLILLLCAYMWLLDKSNFTLLERKIHLLFLVNRSS